MSVTELELLDTFEQDLATSRANLERILASALAIERDPTLRHALSEDPGGVTAVALAASGPYVLIEHGRVTGTALLGPAPDGVDQVLALPDALTRKSHLRQAYRTALIGSEAEAVRLLDSLEHDAEFFSQRAFVALERWAPLLALHAYRQTVAIQSVFDAERSVVLTATAERKRRYWERVHALGHLSVLATSADSTEWLSEMARTFTWRNWTPSFPLARERILRLTVRAGWIAGRFGVDMVAPYLGRIASGQPMHAFDATLGLVSIASVATHEREAIGRELAAVLELRSHGANGALFATMAHSAKFALEEPGSAIQYVSDRAGGKPLAVAVDSNDDAAEFDNAGYFHAILAMAGLAHAPASAFFALPEELNLTSFDPRVDKTRWAN
ncbi:MAG: hypothetical protein QM831_22140 [Kofleriaceae bacterium]